MEKTNLVRGKETKRINCINGGHFVLPATPEGIAGTPLGQK
jgi:hypothetical protein